MVFCPAFSRTKPNAPSALRFYLKTQPSDPMETQETFSVQPSVIAVFRGFLPFSRKRKINGALSNRNIHVKTWPKTTREDLGDDNFPVVIYVQ